MVAAIFSPRVSEVEPWHIPGTNRAGKGHNGICYSLLTKHYSLSSLIFKGPETRSKQLYKSKNNANSIPKNWVEPVLTLRHFARSGYISGPMTR